MRVTPSGAVVAEKPTRHPEPFVDRHGPLTAYELPLHTASGGLLVRWGVEDKETHNEPHGQ